jgi:hypothetical protein
MNQQPDHHSVRRIILPSGRLVEVVHVDPPAPEPQGLHVCPACNSDLVQPVDWNEAGEGFWELALCCPNCHWFGEGVFDREQVDQLEESIDDGLTRMLADLKCLAAANMVEDTERFVAALHADLILPEDF